MKEATNILRKAARGAGVQMDDGMGVSGHGVYDPANSKHSQFNPDDPTHWKHPAHYNEYKLLNQPEHKAQGWQPGRIYIPHHRPQRDSAGPSPNQYQKLWSGHDYYSTPHPRSMESDSGADIKAVELRTVPPSRWGGGLEGILSGNRGGNPGDDHSAWKQARDVDKRSRANMGWDEPDHHIIHPNPDFDPSHPYTSSRPRSRWKISHVHSHSGEVSHSFHNALRRAIHSVRKENAHITKIHYHDDK